MMRAVAPVAAFVLVALCPVPVGLAPHGWLFFAVFLAVVVALVLEPLPAPAVGLAGVTLVAILSRWALFSPAELAAPGFDAPTRAIEWALSGFANATIWLSFTAFLFSTGYQKTGLGRRIALLLVKTMGSRTLLLGYAITLADLILAPFTPSNTARSAGTIFPIIRNLPPLYGSQPHSPSARRIGGYIMWTALAATSINSSLFVTALAPNVLAIEMIRRSTNVEITWVQWFVGFAPAGIVLLVALPVLVFVLYPPQVEKGTQASRWAAAELVKLGPIQRAEIWLGSLILLAIFLWVFASDYMHPTTVALMVVGLMLASRLLTLDDVVANHESWKALILLATLVTLAGGLNRTGFVSWFAEGIAGSIGALPPLATMAVLLTVYYFSHYLFAGITAHVTAMMPIMLAIAARSPGVPIEKFALLLAFSHGLMGVLTPYATTSGPVYLGSGFITTGEFWRLGAIFGFIFLVGLIGIAGPFVLWAS
jgi:L-tartrate/succinate antiporter